MFNIFKSNKNQLIFSFISGLAYYVLILQLLLNYTSNPAMAKLLAFFFFPAIVCGMALVIIKLIRKNIENDEPSKLKALVIIHIILILLAIVAAIGFFI